MELKKTQKQGLYLRWTFEFFSAIMEMKGNLDKNRFYPYSLRPFLF